MTITASTISGNSAYGAAAASTTAARLTITASTISGNSAIATATGGGI